MLLLALACLASLTATQDAARDARARIDARAHVKVLIEEERFEEGLEYVTSLETGVLSPFLRDWYDHYFRVPLEDYSGALAALDRCIALRPDYAEAHRGRGNMLVRLMQTCEAIRAYEQAVKLDPKRVESRAALAHAWIVRGDHDAAGEVLARAGALDLRSPLLDDAAETLSHARITLGDEHLGRASSERFNIAARASSERSRRALTALNDAFAIAEAVVRPLPDSSCTYAPIRVYLFSSAKEFEAYGERVYDKLVSRTGMYNHEFGQAIVLWSTKKSGLRTLHHEGTHMYLSRLAPDPPYWLNEGLACYLEHYRLVEGMPVAPLKRSVRLAPLFEEGFVWPALDRYFEFDNHEFYADKDTSYALGLAVVHYLMEGGPEALALKETVLGDLTAGVSHLGLDAGSWAGSTRTRYFKKCAPTSLDSDGGTGRPDQLPGVNEISSSRSSVPGLVSSTVTAR